MNRHANLKLPKVIAHRGVSFWTPENTLASLYKVAEVGATWVEFDVMLTADRVPIVMHDETLTRTTNGQGIVAEMTYAEISKLDAGTWFAPEFAGEKVPKLDEYLDLALQLGLGVNIEIKATEGSALKTEKAVIHEIKKHWPTSNQDILISSHNIESLRAFQLMEVDYPLALVLAAWRPDWQKIVKSLDFVSLNIHHSMLTPESVLEVKNLTDYLLVFTVNDRVTAQCCYDLGADGIFSDCPDVFL